METTDDLVRKVADNIGRIQVPGEVGVPVGSLISCLPLNIQIPRTVLESIARVAIASVPRRSR